MIAYINRPTSQEVRLPRDGGEARRRILACAEELVRKNGANVVTVEGVAKAAGAAKGLVHYHFKTKKGLLTAVTERLSESRIRSWSQAFEAESPGQAIDQSWKLLTEESKNGTLRGWVTLLGSEEYLSDHSTKNSLRRFSESVGGAMVKMLKEAMGLSPTVHSGEVGQLMVAIIDGIGFQLLGGADPEELHGAYAAAWLGLLSLTQPRA